MSSTPVPGTPWCIVWTGDNKSFFFNPTTKKSVWERPPELVGRADVKEMLKSAAAAEKVKRKTAQGGSKSDESGSDSDEVNMTLLSWMFFRFDLWQYKFLTSRIYTHLTHHFNSLIQPKFSDNSKISPSRLTGLPKNVKKQP